jgi:hypothetical protein
MRSLWRLKLVSSVSESCDARDHIFGSWASQCFRDLTISSFIVWTTPENASNAFSAGGCGSLKFSCSLDASTHASDDIDGPRAYRYHLPMRVVMVNQSPRYESIVEDRRALTSPSTYGDRPRFFFHFNV